MPLHRLRGPASPLRHGTRSSREGLTPGSQGACVDAHAASLETARRLSAVALYRAPEPQGVFSAATCGLRPSGAMQSEHAPGGRLCQGQPSGKKASNPLLGVGVS